MEEDNLLASIPREGQDLNEVEVLDSVDKELQEVEDDTKVEIETPAESLPEKEEPDLKQNEAWKELRLERDREREAREALEARLQALEADKKGDSDFITSLVGENEEVEQKWLQEKQSLKEQVKQEIIQDQINAQRKEQEEKEKWIKWTQERLDEVEKEFKVDFKADESLKNELSKIMTDFTPTDEHGNLDYRKGMAWALEKRELQALKDAQKTQVKKNIADATVSKETSIQSNKGYLTSNDLRGKDWRTLIHQD